MERHFFNIRHIVKQLIITGFFTFFAASIFASKNADNLESFSQPQLQVVNSNESSTLVSLQISNATPVSFEVLIRNAAGELLYRKNYAAAIFSKQFKLSKDPEFYGSDYNIEVLFANGKQFNYELTNKVEIVDEIKLRHK